MRTTFFLIQSVILAAGCSGNGNLDCETNAWMSQNDDSACGSGVIERYQRDTFDETTEDIEVLVTVAAITNLYVSVSSVDGLIEEGTYDGGVNNIEMQTIERSSVTITKLDRDAELVSARFELVGERGLTDGTMLAVEISGEYFDVPFDPEDHFE